MERFFPTRLIRWIKQPTTDAGRLAKFLVRVLYHFFGKNNGLLLAGAVAYNTMLSIVPLCAVILVVSSHFFDEEELLTVISAELALLVPGLTEVLTEALQTFLEERELIGGIGFLVLLFFSSVAFRMFETAIRLIFERPVRRSKKKRQFWVSAVIPYFFIVLIGIGLLVITGVTAAINALFTDQVNAFGYRIPVDWATTLIVQSGGALGLVFLFTSLYMVMPVSKISFRRALIGGASAAILWEVIRFILLWFFTTLSYMNVVYGSIATVIIAFLSMEIAAVIVLLGAQIISDLEHNAEAGLPWYEDHDEQKE
ncbi:MAG: YihY/virulence factor BrkB family protein [Opitutales bacterium]